MHRHLIMKRGHLVGKPPAGFFTQSFDPFFQDVASRVVQAGDFFLVESLGKLHRRKLGPVIDKASLNCQLRFKNVFLYTMVPANAASF